jgi:hypothetical protein
MSASYLEWDLDSVPSTALSTRPPTRQRAPIPTPSPIIDPILLDIIRQGSLGVVYQAVDGMSAGFLAVKVINLNCISKAGVRETFEREIQVMKE